LNSGAKAWVYHVHSEYVGIRAAIGADDRNSLVEDLNTRLNLEQVTTDVINRVSSVNVNTVRVRELECWIISIR